MPQRRHFISTMVFLSRYASSSRERHFLLSSVFPVQWYCLRLDEGDERCPFCGVKGVGADSADFVFFCAIERDLDPIPNSDFLVIGNREPELLDMDYALTDC